MYSADAKERDGLLFPCAKLCEDKRKEILQQIQNHQGENKVTRRVLPPQREREKITAAEIYI